MFLFDVNNRLNYTNNEKEHDQIDRDINLRNYEKKFPPLRYPFSQGWNGILIKIYLPFPPTEILFITYQ